MIRSSASWKVSSRSTLAFQSARLPYVLMNQDRLSWTWPNALADLHQPAERDLAGEVARRADQEREDDRDLVVADGEERQALGVAHQLPPVRLDRAEALLQVGLLRAARRGTARRPRRSHAAAPG